jgi:hypothetical protein
LKRAAWVSIASQFFLLASLPQALVSSSRWDGVPQPFVCNTGYTPQKCSTDMAVLRRALAKYPVARLGRWTWILVLSKDWKAIVTPRGLDPDSPAFTYYAKKETFIEEALVTNVPGRDQELNARWHMSLDQLLDLALAHELGHCLCKDKSEEVANQVAEELIEGRTLSCETLEVGIRVAQIKRPR